MHDPPAHRASPGRDGSPGRPLRILDLTDFYSDTESGGVKTYLHAKADAMERLGLDHVIVVPGDRAYETNLGSTRIVRLPGVVVPVSKAYRVMWSSAALRQVLLRERPDVVEVGSPFVVPHLLRRALGSERVPTVGFYHADVIRTYAEPYLPGRAAAPLRAAARSLARVLVRRVYRRFDVTVAASPSVAAELRALGVPEVRCVGLGVDLKTFRPQPAGERVDWSAYGVQPGVPVGIFAGRFCAEKRLDVLLDGHALLPPEARPHLVLVGGGPHQRRLEAWAARHPRVSVLPYVRDRDELARLYAGADFYLATGPGETFGLSVAEAMASGLPVLAVNRGAAPDRVAGSGAAELYRHEDPADAAKALERLTQRLSPELRARARAHAESSFDWRNTFLALARLYRELVPGAPDVG